MTDAPLIAVEGLDGVGKSAVVERIESWSQGVDHDVVATSEPSPSDAGRAVRESLGGGLPTPMSDLRLFCEDREWHVEHVIEPARDVADAVVVDRYADSTRAYQAAALASDDGDAVSLAEAASRVDDVIDDYDWPRPDLTIYLRLDPATAVERTTRDESYESLATLEKVHERYERLYGRCDTNVRTIDASDALPVVSQKAINAVVTAIETDEEGVSPERGRSYVDAIDDG
jgi:dTMP kinase